MKTNEIMKSVCLTFNKVGFQLQKKSPEILVAAGSRIESGDCLLEIENKN